MAYGLKYVGSLENDAVQPMTRKFKVTANEVITKGDALYLSSGKLKSGTGITGAKIAGIAHETVTGNASGTTTCEIIIPDEHDVFIVDNDNDSTTFAATHVGTYFDIAAVATGVQQVDTSTTGTTGQLLAVEYNPQGYGLDSDTSIGLFCVVETIFHGRTA